MTLSRLYTASRLESSLVLPISGVIPLSWCISDCVALGTNQKLNFKGDVGCGASS
jgi:hypothetical protein